MSLVLKGKLCVLGGKRINRARICWVLQLDENSVKLWKSLPKGKMGRYGRMGLEIAEVLEALEAILFQETQFGQAFPFLSSPFLYLTL
ncbi:unnamed protein product [Prunus armeniaca]